MHTNSWLLPDGVVELKGQFATELESIRRRSLDLFQAWGYDLVFPPMIEFLESLIAGSGQDLALQTFKLTDQVSGRTMGIRADITPQVARLDAYHNNGHVNRLCYVGSVLHTKPVHIMANRTLIQAGAELYGDSGPAGDREIISLLLHTLSLSAAPLDLWTLTFGHAGISQIILNEAHFDTDIQNQVVRALAHKSEPDIQQLFKNNAIDQQQLSICLSLLSYCGSIDVLQTIQTNHPATRKLCETLANTYASLQALWPAINWFFDFTPAQNYDYETGIIFQALHTNSPEPIARGGRYDKLSGYYGSERKAVGFSFDLLAMVQCTDLPQTQQQLLHYWSPCLPAHSEAFAELQAFVQGLRQSGHRVTSSVHTRDWQALDGQLQHKYDGFIFWSGEKWQLQTNE